VSKIYGVSALLLNVQSTENFAFNTRQHETVEIRSRVTDQDMNEI
jgi:hypothetical protein